MADPNDTSGDHDTIHGASYSSFTTGFNRALSAGLGEQKSSSNLELNNKHHKKGSLRKRFKTLLPRRSKKSSKKYDLQTQTVDFDDEIDSIVGTTYHGK